MERSGDERRTVHKRLWKVGIEKVMGKGQKVTTEIERWRRKKKEKHKQERTWMKGRTRETWNNKRGTNSREAEQEIQFNTKTEKKRNEIRQLDKKRQSRTIPSPSSLIDLGSETAKHCMVSYFCCDASCWSDAGLASPSV